MVIYTALSFILVVTQCSGGLVVNHEEELNGQNVKDMNMLKLVSLENYEKALTMDGTPAVYYIQTEDTEERKMLIYLEGGGFCVPRVPGYECLPRCEKEPWLCTASTDPFMDANESKLHASIWNPEPDMNPAFHDFFKVYMPYSSSDVYSGTRDASFLLTNNYTFHGKYIFESFIEDLILNTWITSADKVVLMGESAGAMGTEANCDNLADMLRVHNPDLDVRCITDSGSMYPYSVHTHNCDPHLIEYAAFESWAGKTDESCLADNPTGFPCISINDGYRYAETPFLVLMSSQDTIIRFCYSDDPLFWGVWKAELEAIGRLIIEDRPDIGMFIANCEYHVSNTNAAAWSKMKVPIVGDENGESILLKDLIYNFVYDAGPIHAIDDMDNINENCNSVAVDSVKPLL